MALSNLTVKVFFIGFKSANTICTIYGFVVTVGYYRQLHSKLLPSCKSHLVLLVIKIIMSYENFMLTSNVKQLLQEKTNKFLLPVRQFHYVNKASFQNKKNGKAYVVIL